MIVVLSALVPPKEVDESKSSDDKGGSNNVSPDAVKETKEEGKPKSKQTMLISEEGKEEVQVISSPPAELAKALPSRPLSKLLVLSRALWS